MTFVKRSEAERLQAIAEKPNPKQLWHILPDGFMDYGGDIFLEEMTDPVPPNYTFVPPPEVGMWRHLWDGEDWIEGGSPPPPPENPEPPTPTIEMAMGLIALLQQSDVTLQGVDADLDYRIALLNNAITIQNQTITTLLQRIAALESDMVRVKGVVNID